MIKKLRCAYKELEYRSYVDTKGNPQKAAYPVPCPNPPIGEWPMLSEGLPAKPFCEKHKPQPQKMLNYYCGIGAIVLYSESKSSQ